MSSRRGLQRQRGLQRTSQSSSSQRGPQIPSTKQVNCMGGRESRTIAWKASRLV